MKKILIVDDEPYLRLLYEFELHRCGYETATVADAKQCLEFVAAIAVDLVILDIRMPQMDGIEVLHKLVDQQPNLPVIINTAYSSYQDNYLVSLADAFVVKSSDLSDLMANVKRLLGHNDEDPKKQVAPKGFEGHPNERNCRVDQSAPHAG